MEEKDRIVNYWKIRSESFVAQRRDELHDPIAERWLREIGEVLPPGKELCILDAGCGAGFFSILLARMGHKVTGIDLTPEMIEKGKLLAREEKADCQLLVMDAERLNFPDESFDFVVTRNLTWTLPHLKDAYREWLRVLKKGGVLLNFDADYGLEDTEDVSGLPPIHAHHMLGEWMRRENNEIKKALDISSHRRPFWDVALLAALGVQKFQLDLGVSDRIYLNVDEFYNPTPLFKLCAVK